MILDTLNIIITLITDGYTDYLVGSDPIADIVYSVISYVDTGVVVEDSVFWDSCTMGNMSC